MEMSRPIVWLFRESTPRDRYEKAFDQAGFEPVFIPVLSTEILAPPESVPSVDAVVVTSARAAAAVGDWKKVEELKRLPWFAIGKATRAAVESLGITTRQPAHGSADSLAEIILDAGVERVLFLAGDPHRPELPARLRRNGVALNIAIVYRTHEKSIDLPDNVEPPDWAVFFSPRGVRIVAEQASLDWDEIRKAAIGPTTAEALRDVGWEPSAIAGSPTPESLLRAIQTVGADIH